MQPTRSLILSASISALLGVSGMAHAKSVDTSKEMAKQLQALRDQVEALQKRLDQQAVADSATKAKADAAAAQAAQAQAATQQQAASLPAEVKAQVKTEVEANKPKSDKLYYKGVSITLGGFAAFESIYRTHNETSDISSSFAAIPYPNNAVGQTHELRFTARQTRFSALMEGDPNAYTHLGFYGEFDFQSAAQTANNNESSSYNLRIRNLYGSIDWTDLGLHLMGGQNWSLTTMNGKGITQRNEYIPPTIDAQYIPGFVWARQAQIRLTKDFDKTLWVAVSAENPATTFSGATPAGTIITNTATGGNSSTTGTAVSSPSGFSGFNSVNSLSLNHIPDAVFKIAYEPTFAGRTVHLEGFYLYRSFYERLSYKNEDHSGGGGGGGLTVQVIPKVLDFQVSGIAGKGIGRYGSGQLPDVTFDQGGHIKPIREVMALAGVTLHATPNLDFYLFGGEEKESAQPYYVTSAAGVTSGFGYGNPLFVNSGCESQVSTGACTGNTRLIQQGTFGFWHKPYTGAYGTIRYGLQYSWTERKAFSGAGISGPYAPVATDNMLFMSFRYYPFQ